MNRACIALAIEREYDVITCDKIWQKIDVGIKFVMAR
jgi:PIN domain nuclease of toxin-antitoxin system